MIDLGTLYSILHAYEVEFEEGERNGLPEPYLSLFVSNHEALVEEIDRLTREIKEVYQKFNF